MSKKNKKQKQEANKLNLLKTFDVIDQNDENELEEGQNKSGFIADYRHTPAVSTPVPKQEEKVPEAGEEKQDEPEQNKSENKNDSADEAQKEPEQEAADADIEKQDAPQQNKNEEENVFADEAQEEPEKEAPKADAEKQERPEQNKNEGKNVSADEKLEWKIPEPPKKLGKKKTIDSQKGNGDFVVKKTSNGATLPVRMPSVPEEGMSGSGKDPIISTDERNVTEKHKGAGDTKKKIIDFFEKAPKEKAPRKGELPYRGWFERPAVGVQTAQPEQEKEDETVSEDRTKEVKETKTEAKKKTERHKGAGFSADYRSKKEHPVEDDLSEDNDTEIDDFLAEGNSDDELLTKWSDEEPHNEVPKRSVRPVPKKTGKHRYGVVVGSMVLLLALVGVVFIAGSIGRHIYNVATDDSALREYDTFLTPIVMQDPAPFANSAKASEEFVLNASLWKAITANNGTNYSEYDNNGRALVPLGDVVDACHELFGPECQLQPKTPAEETFFEYNSDENKFHVSLYSSDSSYTPYTESAKKEGDSVVLRVGYVSPSDEWRNQTNSALSGPSPTKYMKYRLKLNSDTGKYYVFSIQAEPNEMKKS